MNRQHVEDKLLAYVKELPVDVSQEVVKQLQALTKSTRGWASQSRTDEDALHRASTAHVLHLVADLVEAILQEKKA